MRRLPLVLGLLALLAFSAPAAEEEYDGDTLAGMAAEVRENWVLAVDAFARALAAAPEDELRLARLAAARRRGLDEWLVAARKNLRAKRPRSAALAAAVARQIAPDDHDVAVVLARLEKEGEEVPEVPADSVAPPGLPGRTPMGRIRALLRMEARGEDVDALVRGGQDYLLASREPTGEWSPEKHGGEELYEAGVSGLALMALLVDGPSVLEGDRGGAIRKAAARLAAMQGPEGIIANRRTDHYTYCHAIATEALSLYALTVGAGEKLRPKLAAARDHILKMQVPGMGWRYGWEPTDSDTSVTFWMASALDRLRQVGLDVPAASLAGAAAWVDKVTAEEQGRVGYTGPGNGPARPQELLDRFPSERSEALTAAGMVILHIAGRAPNALTRKQRGLILGVPPASDVPDMYYWHLGARALVATDGRIPGKWLGALVRAAKWLQDPDGSIRPAGPWGKDGGRVYSTAMTVLALSAPWADASGPVRMDTRPVLGSDGTTIEFTPSGGPLATGIYLDEGMNVIADPEGRVRAGPGAEFKGPEGGAEPKGHDRLSRRGRYGCLLGQIGPDGDPFPIRHRGRLRIRGCGQLYLLLNEEDPSKAEGSFTVGLELVD